MEKLIKLEHFFASDTKIKKEMTAMCPPNEFMGEDEMIKYLDDLFDSLSYIFAELKTMANDYDVSLLPKIEALEKLTNENFLKCGTDLGKLKTVYEATITSMSPAFLESVKKEIKGYYALGSKDATLSKVVTANEMLHLMHSCVMNNEDILQAIPEIAKKEIPKKMYAPTEICLRGKSTETFNNLFSAFPDGFKCGDTDMVAINDNKLIMMVRDLGHALTMEVTIKNNVARIEYFIPKICNVEMVNSLPGILNKVDQNSFGANGVIEVDKNMLPQTIYVFMAKVPTDLDMTNNYSEENPISL